MLKFLEDELDDVYTIKQHHSQRMSTLKNLHSYSNHGEQVHTDSDNDNEADLTAKHRPVRE